MSQVALALDALEIYPGTRTCNLRLCGPTDGGVACLPRSIPGMVACKCEMYLDLPDNIGGAKRPRWSDERVSACGAATSSHSDEEAGIGPRVDVPGSRTPR